MESFEGLFGEETEDFSVEFGEGTQDSPRGRSWSFDQEDYVPYRGTEDLTTAQAMMEGHEYQICQPNYGHYEVPMVYQDNEGEKDSFNWPIQQSQPIQLADIVLRNGIPYEHGDIESPRNFQFQHHQTEVLEEEGSFPCIQREVQFVSPDLAHRSNFQSVDKVNPIPNDLLTPDKVNTLPERVRICGKFDGEIVVAKGLVRGLRKWMMKMINQDKQDLSLYTAEESFLLKYIKGFLQMKFPDHQFEEEDVVVFLLMTYQGENFRNKRIKELTKKFFSKLEDVTVTVFLKPTKELVRKFFQVSVVRVFWRKYQEEGMVREHKKVQELDKEELWKLNKYLVEVGAT